MDIGSASRILVAATNSHMADALRTLLLANGYAVVMAPEGAAALKAVATHPPAAVLLDINLPDADGLALCARLRAVSETRVIFVTARSTDADILAGFAHGADDYVTVPFNDQILLSRLKAVLRAF